MLIDIESGKTIERIPHVGDFNSLRRRLSDDEFDRMIGRINELIDGLPSARGARDERPSRIVTTTTWSDGSSYR